MKKFIVILLVVLAVISVTAFVLINLKGKDVIVSQLQSKLNADVKIGSVKIIFPITVKLHNLSIENFLETKELAVQPSILSLFTGNIAISKISLVSPKIIVEKTRGGSFNFASLLKPTSGEAKKVIIGKIVIKDGSVDFIDRKISSEGFRFKIINLNVNVSNLMSPRFKINAKAQGSDSSTIGFVKADGWISLLRKDMKAKFELSDLDGAYFSPYFQKFLSSQKLKSAIVNSQINLIAENNEIDGKCHLEIDEIVYEEEPDSEQGEGGLPSPLSFVLGAGGSKPKQITLDLPIKGTLIPFKINFVKITGSIFTEMLKEVISEPEKIEEKFKDIGEQFEGFGKQLEKSFKEKYKKQEDQN